MGRVWQTNITRQLYKNIDAPFLFLHTLDTLHKIHVSFSHWLRLIQSHMETRKKMTKPQTNSPPPHLPLRATSERSPTYKCHIQWLLAARPTPKTTPADRSRSLVAPTPVCMGML